MKLSNSNLSCITPDALTPQTGIRACFTLKNQDFHSPKSNIAGLNLGNNTAEAESVIARNRALLLEQLEINPEWVAYADQVHSNRIQLVTEGGIYGATDGLITRIPGLALAIQVADCAAVLLWDASNKVIGAFHAGWRGAVAEIVPRGIQMMIDNRAVMDEIAAFVSPCISQKNFEVGREVAEQFPAKFVDKIHYDKPHVNLKEFLCYQMTETGIAGSNIEVRPECTIEKASDFYSYRREGNQSGRMMAIIQVKP